MTCPNCGQRLAPGDLTCPACGEVTLALPAGTRLYHRYRILRALGRTGGISYLAEDEDHQRQVLLLEFFPSGARRLGTLAILPEGAEGRRQQWLNLLRERTEAMDSGLQRPQLVFEQHGTAYAVTALPLGEPLLARVQSGRLLDATEAMTLLTTLAQGTAELQRHGRHDGQLGPHRVSLTPGGPRLDLGWAEEQPAAYTAPEQTLTPPRSSPASDVYALSALTLFALTGQVLPRAGQRALGQALPALPIGLPAQLQQALERGLTLNGNDRLQDAATLLRLLRNTGTPNTVNAGGTSAQPPKVQVIRAHQSWLTHVATDGQRILTAGADLRVRVFDRHGQPLGQYDGLKGKPAGLAFTPAGIVIGDESGTVTVWNGGPGVPHAQTGHKHLNHLIVRSGQQAITLQDDGALGVWRLDSPSQTGQVPFRAGRITSLHATAEDLLLLGTVEGQVQLFDESVLLTTTLWQHPDRLAVTALTSSSVTPSLVAAAAGQSVTMIDSGHTVLTVDIQEPVTALTFSPDGACLALTGRSGGLHHIRLQTGERRLLHRSPVPLRTLAWNETLLVAGNEAGQLMIVPVPEEPIL